jgi:WD40 repeat protein
MHYQLSILFSGKTNITKTHPSHPPRRRSLPLLKYSEPLDEMGRILSYLTELCKHVRYESQHLRLYIPLVQMIIDLEMHLSKALEEISQFSTRGANTQTRNDCPLPAKSVLVGHPNKINAISSHPLYSVLASTSVDATVRVWDCDTGELGHTLKSHKIG